MTAESTPAAIAPLGGKQGYDPEYARMEAWLDEHPDFAQDYFLRLELRLLFSVCGILIHARRRKGPSP